MPIAPRTPIEQVAIADIHVGQRRRKTLGGLSSLKKSIESRGLLHPIILRNGNELVAGARRLESCKQLGWKSIPARRIEDMDNDELRAIEVDENDQRLALADYESSKARLAEIRQAEAEARAEKRSAPERKSKGRPVKPGSERDIEKRTGVKPTTRRRIEKHVAIAEAFPFMQREGWKQYTVLEAGEALTGIPEKEHPALAVLLDQPMIPPKTVINLIRNMANKTKAIRSKAYALAKSADSEDRDNALAIAAELPKVPHACLLEALSFQSFVSKCKKHSAFGSVLEKFISDLREERSNGK